MKESNFYSQSSIQKLQEQFKLGNTILYNLFSETYGSNGKNILLDNEKSNGPTISKNSFEILKKVRTESAFENFVFLIFQDGFQKLQFFNSKEITTYFLISSYILVQGWKNTINPADNIEINLGIDRTINYLLLRLNEIAQPITKKLDWKNILEHYIPEEEDILALVNKTITSDGKISQLKIDSKVGQQLKIEIQRGMNINYGYYSPYFVTDTNSMEIEFEEPFILLTTQCLNLDNIKIKKILEPIIQEGRPLVIFSPDIKEETLQSLILNKVNGIVDIAYVKVPQLFSTNFNTFKDLAFYTQANLIEKEIDWKNITIKDLGRADKIVINKTKTSISQNRYHVNSELESRCNQIKQQVLTTNSDYDNEKLKDRQRSLMGYTPILYIGGETALETSELESRVKQAFLSTESCLYEGIVPNIEIVSLIFDEELENWSRANLCGSAVIGNKIVKRALLEPTKLSIEKLANTRSLNSQKFLNTLKTLRKINTQEINEELINEIIALGFYDSLKTIQAGLKIVSALTQSILSIEKSLI